MSVPRLKHVETSLWLDIGLAAGSQGGVLYVSGLARSTWDCPDIGYREVDRQIESLSGVPGVFEVRHGQRSRRIRWGGTLRATVAARSTILSQMDAFAALPGEFLFVDWSDTEYAGCAIEALSLGGAGVRLTDPVMGEIWVSPYEIVLNQLAVPS